MKERGSWLCFAQPPPFKPPSNYFLLKLFSVHIWFFKTDFYIRCIMRRLLSVVRRALVTRPKWSVVITPTAAPNIENAPGFPRATTNMPNSHGVFAIVTTCSKPRLISATRCMPSPVVPLVQDIGKVHSKHYSEIEFKHFNARYHWLNSERKEGFYLDIIDDKLCVINTIDGIITPAYRELIIHAFGPADRQKVLVVPYVVMLYCASRSNIVTRYLHEYTMITDTAISNYTFYENDDVLIDAPIDDS